MALREFLHRRDDLVSQFFEQLEGGLYDEERIKEQSGRRSGVGASAGIGAARFSADRGKDGSTEAELTMRQTPAPRFNRLYNLLEAQGSVQQLTALDDDIWQQIDRKEVIEVDAVLSLLPGVLDLHQAAGVGSLAPVVELMQSLPDELLPDNFSRREAEQMTSQMPAIQDFTDHMSTGPVPCRRAPLHVLRRARPGRPPRRGSRARRRSDGPREDSAQDRQGQARDRRASPPRHAAEPASTSPGGTAGTLDDSTAVPGSGRHRHRDLPVGASMATIDEKRRWRFELLRVRYEEVDVVPELHARIATSLN